MKFWVPPSTKSNAHKVGPAIISEYCIISSIVRATSDAMGIELPWSSRAYAAPRRYRSQATTASLARPVRMFCSALSPSRRTVPTGRVQTCALYGAPFVVFAIFLRWTPCFGYPIKNTPQPRVGPFYFHVIVPSSAILHRSTALGNCPWRHRAAPEVPRHLAYIRCRSRVHVAVADIVKPLWV